MSTTRRPKWHPPAPPTPKIIHFSRRHRRKPARSAAGRPTSSRDSELRRMTQTAKLSTLFDQERTFSRTVPLVLLDSGDCRERRERVEEEGEGGRLGEEKWRFQAEILRAECNFLRMERESVQGRQKICEGESASAVLKEEIEELAKKLQEVQQSSRVRDFEVPKCSNFDKKTFLLQRRLEKLRGVSGDKCVKGLREMAEASLSINVNCRFEERLALNRKCGYNYTDVEGLRRKMEEEGLIKGLKKEGSLLQESMFHEENTCSGHCKVVVRRIIEQVRAETEQWSQMQKMLEQVREEMEELQASRDFWEERALGSDCQVQSLYSALQEWRLQALSSETKVNELQAEMSVLNSELRRLRMDQKASVMGRKGLPPIPRDAQSEKEKRVLICQLKENHHTIGDGSKKKEAYIEGRREIQRCSCGAVAPKQAPFRDVGNVSLPVRPNCKASFSLHCSKPSNTKDRS
ncbi:uncharacterized protein LOC131148426 [Malania oleifera]|uniref:uncharacterized protein LOC131148426 n=1 Tax=Malania oleifera TaxID=397392 RepID=UPI0025AE32D4|nr:uncharacterized protein LOC131148426 [Malania oleifera]